MKKTLLFLLLFAASTQFTKAQDKFAYEKGDQTLQLGFGIGATFSTGSVKVPPIQLHYEYGITEEVSIGGILGYASSTSTYNKGNYGSTLSSTKQEIKYKYTIFGARGNYHFGTTERFDPYGGATLGYYNIGFNDDGGYMGSFASSSIIYGGQIGANYYFSPKIGAWAEIGYGIGILNLGLTVKF